MTHCHPHTQTSLHVVLVVQVVTQVMVVVGVEGADIVHLSLGLNTTGSPDWHPSVRSELNTNTGAGLGSDPSLQSTRARG